MVGTPTLFTRVCGSIQDGNLLQLIASYVLNDSILVLHLMNINEIANI